MSDIFGLFDKIYVINLASRPDRLREMGQQLRAIGLSFESPAVALFPAVRIAGKGGFRSAGVRGCFLSHLGVLKNASQEGHQRIAIFEDDLSFHADFPARIVEVGEKLKAHDWSIFYGGHHTEGAQLPPGSDCQPVPAEIAIQSAHFVAFRGPVIELTTAYLEAMLLRRAGHPDGGPMDVDGAYSWFRRNHAELLTCLAVPPLGFQRASRSDLSPSWYDRIGAFRQVADALRKMRAGAAP